MTEGLTMGIDVGGTKVLAGVVDATGTVVAQARRDTPAKDVAQILNRIIDVVHELTASHQITAIGIGAAGMIDAQRSTVLFAPNIAWRHEPLRDKVSEHVSVPVVVENDANAAAWAEFQFGAAKDAHDSMAMVTIGTGIGGGLVLNGELIRGGHGMAAEFGHVRAVPYGQLCGCGRLGCIEQYASGGALLRYARTGVNAHPDRGQRLLELAHGSVDAITGRMVTQAALDGDGVARAAFEQAGAWLGNALADMVQMVDPQVLVIGGGVIAAGDLLLRPAREALDEALAQRGRLPLAEVRPAVLGNLAGVVGAADLARRK